MGRTSPFRTPEEKARFLLDFTRDIFLGRVQAGAESTKDLHRTLAQIHDQLETFYENLYERER